LNHITEKQGIGSFGELLVQIRLLQCGVQAARPFIDTGNDLIAVNGNEFRAVSVRTTARESYKKPDASRRFHVLAVVHLVDSETEVFLDQSELFLIPKEEVADAPTHHTNLGAYKFSREHVAKLFGTSAPPPASNLKSLTIKLWKSLLHKTVIFRGSRRKFANLRDSLSSIQRAEPLVNRRY
jgi:hypothetical protein